MKLTLPLPISVNKMYVSGFNGGKFRRWKSKESKEWEDAAMIEISRQRVGQKKPKGDTIYVTFHITKHGKRKWDSSNYLKILYDTLVTKEVLADDTDLIFEQIQKVYDGKDYCEVEIL